MNHFTPRGLKNAGDFIAREAEFGAKNYKPLDVVLARGEGVYVWDVDGKRYLDCLSAYSAVNQGHCHPAHPGGDDRAGRASSPSPRAPSATTSWRLSTRSFAR